MKRWSEQHSDSARLPHGMRRIGYDADEEVYTYRDEYGRIYEGAPGARYGVLRQRMKEEPQYPTARDYLEGHPETYDQVEPEQDGDQGSDVYERTLVEKIVSPTKDLIRSVSKSTRSRRVSTTSVLPDATSSSRSPSVPGPATPSGLTGRLRTLSASQMTSLARNLTSQITARGEQLCESTTDGKHPTCGKGSALSLQIDASNTTQEKAPRRVQTMRDYIQHGRDERSHPSEWLKTHIATTPKLKRSGTR